jgi:lipopolysaccharide/colanic/teichoic acid biosynthesis glycosyltransferase
MRRKRVFDTLAALALLVLFSPLLVAAALAVKLSSAGPAIYRQRRIGRGGQPFEIWKFRTMAVGAENLMVDLTRRNFADGLLFKVLDDPRVTRVGRVFRRLSIDELPQLVNVLRGEMSLVGPRPLAVDQGSFDKEADLRHTVRPGITGAWQVAGGNSLPYQEMIRLDLAYIEDWSLMLDIRLLARTVRVALHPHGPW